MQINRKLVCAAVLSAVVAVGVLGFTAPTQAAQAAQPTQAARPAQAQRVDHAAPTSSPSRPFARVAHPRSARTWWQAAVRHAANRDTGSTRGGRTVPLGTSLQIFDVDVRTGTAYTSSDEGTVSVVDVKHCNARRSASCGGPIAELPGPSDAAGVAVYRHTLYVSSGVSGTNGAVSVYDILHCRTGDVSGCGSAIATVPIADIPVGLAVNRSTRTLYVGNVADHVDVLALASCRRADTSGCASADVGSIPAADGPVFPTLDSRHDTLYVPANGPDADASGDSVHVIDLRRCRAGDTSGCAAHEATLPAGAGAVIALLDRRTGTLYVQNQNAATVSVLDVRRCTGVDDRGCAQTPTDIPVGANPSGDMVITKDGRFYGANSDSDTLSTFSTRHCRAGDTAGCPTSPPPTARAEGAPFWLGYDAHTGSIFTTEHAGKALGVIDANVCSRDALTCRHLLPSLDSNEEQLADDAVHTWYGSDDDNNLTLIDTRVCTARHAQRCAAAAVHTSQPNTAFGGLIADDSTHTLYLINIDFTTFQGSLVAIDTRTCNATVHTDCAPVAAPMPIPNYTTTQLAINRRTHTVYITTQSDSTLQVVDGSRCNAMVQTGCAAPVAQLPLDGVIYGVTTDASTRTVYVSEFGADFDSDVVYAIDTTHCRGGDVSGCAQTPKQFTTGLAPLGMVVDHRKHTLYVLANGAGVPGGQIDVIDTRTCSARSVAGCAPAIAFDVDRTPFLGALDPVTGHLYTSDFEHASVSVIDTERCNVTDTRDCRDRQFDVGDSPGPVAVDPVTHSAFVHTGLYNTTYYVDTRRNGHLHA